MNSLGWPFSHTLYLSDTFLTHSEWRQRDALICQLLMSRRAPTQRRFHRRQRLAQVTLTALILALILALIGFSLYSTTLDNFTLYDGLTFEGALLGLSAISLSIAFVNLARQRRRQTDQRDDAVTPNDRAIIALYGDPLALAGTLVTTLSLQGIDLDGTVLTGRWTQKDHILAIERTLRQPGPYAPWAFRPIPTLEPLPVEPTLEAFPLSVPLTTASRDTPPAPVPATRYPVTNSPWQGTPEQGS